MARVFLLRVVEDADPYESYSQPILESVGEGFHPLPQPPSVREVAE